VLTEKLNDKNNQFVLTTITALCAAAGLAISKYLLGSQLDLTEILVFAVIFWAIFYIVQSLTAKRMAKK